MNLRIKYICDDKNIRVTDLADNVGMSRPNLYNIVNGKINPPLSTLEKIAAALGVELWELFVSREEKDGTNFCAMVRSGANMYSADSLSQLERLVAWLKENEEMANKEEGK